MGAVGMPKYSMKPRRRGFSIHKITLPADMTTVEYLYSVQYCSRCGAEYDTHMAALYLEEDEDLGSDDDEEQLAKCRNPLACDGNLVESAAEDIDMVRHRMVEGQQLGSREYELLTEAFDALVKVYPGLWVEAPRCGKCLGPLPDGVEDESHCRFCEEEETAQTDG